MGVLVSRPMNCWEYHKCGRQPGGDRSLTEGICPAAGTTELNGRNHGINGGRICWAVAGTYCGGKVQGIFAMKIETCLRCPFFQKVEREEGTEFMLHPEQGLDEEL